jgi:hypothetical protein
MPKAAFIALLWLAQAGAPVQAQQINPHALYEDKCAMCHEPHAGDFANARLDWADGKVVGERSGRPLDTLLLRHHGTGLSRPETDVLIEQFAFILQSGRIFRDKCLICHDRAAQFARRMLKQADDRLIGRYSKRDIGAFLYTHGRLTPQEREVILDMLERQVASGDSRVIGPQASPVE